MKQNKSVVKCTQCNTLHLYGKRIAGEYKSKCPACGSVKYTTNIRTPIRFSQQIIL